MFIFVFQFFIKHVIAGFTRSLEQFPDFVFGFLHTDIICRFARIIRFGFNKKSSFIDLYGDFYDLIVFFQIVPVIVQKPCVVAPVLLYFNVCFQKNLRA